MNQRVTITREKLRPVRVQAGGRYRKDADGLYQWTYNYTVDDGALCQYGTSLRSLVAMLKHWHPGADIEKSWESN